MICRAPGRIEFIGNHTDYNGGEVLGAAIDRGVWVAVAPAEGPRRFRSEFSDTVVEQAGPRQREEGDRAWVNYPTGVLAGMEAFGVTAPEGFDYAVISDLPQGAGLSSSAAIELASGLAFLGLAGAELSRENLVKLGRWAENEFVGVPCGILDQGVSGFGRRDSLVHIDCRGPTFSTVPMPTGVKFWVFNTPSGHALVDGLYAERHRECMAAAEALGVACLADASLEQLENARGLMTVESYSRAKHVISEIARVGAMCAALKSGDFADVGRLLTASHHSSQRDFANSTVQLDWLVDHLIETSGVLGARLTGGGFGGAVMGLATAEFDERAAKKVSQHFAEKFGQSPQVLQLATGNGAERIV
ncbi:galactokinase [Opitutaceae bacterium LMO-CP1]|uniref:galactokinase n=1 Tax=Synoicihabitans lomoniglobus TaxID=2909285 RepID=UPI003021CD20|nr:galactokinase [Opitutaceae bacterium LMO-M01]